MSTIQVLILSIFIAFLILEIYGYGYWMIFPSDFCGTAHPGPFAGGMCRRVFWWVEA